MTHLSSTSVTLSRLSPSTPNNAWRYFFDGREMHMSPPYTNRHLLIPSWICKKCLGSTWPFSAPRPWRWEDHCVTLSQGVITPMSFPVYYFAQNRKEGFTGELQIAIEKIIMCGVSIYWQTKKTLQPGLQLLCNRRFNLYWSTSKNMSFFFSSRHWFTPPVSTHILLNETTHDQSHA